MAESDVATATSEQTAAEQAPRKLKTQKIGRVVSNKMDKTVVVSVDYLRRHPIYNKRITRTSKFFAHDEANECREGDLVRIEECRPLSRNKHWVVREIIERGIQI
jgi:small subunit ribosomal protein S17